MPKERLDSAQKVKVMPNIISYSTTGDFSKTETFLMKLLKKDFTSVLHRYGKRGVDALQAATPVDTGTTAHSWGYTVTESPGSATITWTNSNVNQGIPIVLLIEYGHGTSTGGYVQPRPFIKDTIEPIIDELADALWKEVTRS